MKEKEGEEGVRIEKSRVKAERIAGRDLVEVHGDVHVHSSATSDADREALPPVTVPPLPTNFLPRAAAVDALVKALLQKPSNGSGTVALTAVAGMGGIGKTVLAQALCRDERVKKAFPDGIVWQSIGKESTYKIGARLRAVRLALGDRSQCEGNELDCYRAALAGKAALVVIDDVWSVADIEPWLAESPRSRVLFTTRDVSIAEGIGVTPHWAELLSEEESWKALGQWSGRKREQLPEEAGEIIRECGRLPLALAMVGAMLRGKPDKLWPQTLKLLKNADLEKIKAQFPGYTHLNMVAAIEVSVKALEPEERERYYALAVLLEDMSAAPTVQQTLWGIGEDEASEMAEKFIGLSLAQRDGDGQSIVLHDLQLDYIRAHFVDAEALSLIHGAMRLSWHVISEDLSQFVSQVIGRLLVHEVRSAIGTFVRNLSSNARVPWIRLRSATVDSSGSSLVRILPLEWDNIAISRDSRRAILASSDYRMTVWDIEKGRVMWDFKGHEGWVNKIAISGDGRRAVSASEDGTVKVWDVEKGRTLQTLDGKAGEVHEVTISGDGRRIASATGGTITVRNVNSRRALRTLKGDADWIDAVAMSGDGQRVISAAANIVTVWDVKSGCVAQNLSHTDRVHTVAMNDDGRRAISASKDWTVRVSDVESGRTKQILKGHPNCAGMSGDGRRVVTVSPDETLRVWDVESGREIRTLKDADKAPHHAIVVISMDGRRVVSCGEQGTVRVWDVESRNNLQPLRGHRNVVDAVAMSMDGRRALSASQDGTLKVWDAERARELQTLTEDLNIIRAAAMSMDGALAVSASEDHTLAVWDVESRNQVCRLVGHTGSVCGVAMSVDGRRVISASVDKTVKVWDVEAGYELRTLTGHRESVYAVALSVDGRRAVSASEDHTLKVWDVESGNEVCTLKGHTDAATRVAVSADGRYAISASMTVLKIWNLERKGEICTLLGHTLMINGVAMRADGRYAVSVSEDRTLRLWDVEWACERARFSWDCPPLSCALSDSNRVVVGDSFGRVHFLELILERTELAGKERVSKEGATEIRTERVMTDQAGRKKHVFLSYCRENQEEVRRLRDELVAAGEAVWWDKDIKPGKLWRPAIAEAMNSAYAVVVCLSRELAAREASGLYSELRDAIAEYRNCKPDSIFLILVRLSECPVPDIDIDSTTKLKDLQYLDLFPDAERRKRMRDLVNAIQDALHHPRQARRK